MPRNRYNSYNHGSTAFKLDTVQPQETPPQIQQPKVELAPSPKPNYKVAVTSGVCLGTSLVTIFSFLGLQTNFMMKQIELQSLNTQLQNTKSTINTVQSNITSNLNLDYIESIAQEELGMISPMPHQIVYLDIQNESYTTYGN